MLHKHTVTALAVSALIAGAAAVLAGPLSPPSGAVAGTYKTLAEVEPRIPVSAATAPGDTYALYRITQPGSYYLTGPVDSVAKTGIRVEAPNVTLDLRGYAITVTGTGQVSAIAVVPGLDSTTIRNGTVVSGPHLGINAAGTFGGRYENLTAGNCGTVGMWLGARASVTNCTAHHCGTNGFVIEPHSTISACHAYDNSQDGFSIGGSCIATGCTSDGNGDDGYAIAAGAIVERCTARANASDGFESGGRASIIGCNAYGNAAAGFRPNGTGTLRHCTASANSVGIRSETGTGLLIEGNECSDNTSFGLWMNGATGCRIDGNQFFSNGGSGLMLNANGAHLVIRNTARANAGGNYNIDSASDSAQVLTNPGAGFVVTNAWANFSY